MFQALGVSDRYPSVPSVSRWLVRQCIRAPLVELLGYVSAAWLSPTRYVFAVGNRFLSWIQVLRFDYSRVTRVLSTSCGSSSEPAVFAHFWLRQCRMVLRPYLYCILSRFTIVWSLYWVLGLCGVSPVFSVARDGYNGTWVGGGGVKENLTNSRRLMLRFDRLELVNVEV